METQFAERYGLDREVPLALANEPQLHLISHDVEVDRKLPFEAEFFDVVTMLAVFEHLEESVLVDLLREITRVLVHNGIFVMTTPADWTAGILKVMSQLGMVSGDEVGEHKAQYSQQHIRELLTRGAFDPGMVEVGSFEIGMNLWARATRG